MAIITQAAGTYDAGGPVSLEVDYDSALKLLTAFRCKHTGTSAFPAKLVSGAVVYGQAFPAGQTTTMVIPTTGANKVACVLNNRSGKMGGYNVFTGF